MLYCRQRQLKQGLGRKKSCVSCRRAKTRCTETLPQCTRCQSKGLACKYDGQPRIDSTPQLLSLSEGEPNRDLPVDDPTAIGAELPALPAQAMHLPILSSEFEHLLEVDFSQNDLPSSLTQLSDPLLDLRINLDWGIEAPPIAEYQSNNGDFDSNYLSQTSQNIYDSPHQPTALPSLNLPNLEVERLVDVSRYTVRSRSSLTTLLANNISSFQPPTVYDQFFVDANGAGVEMSLLSARAARIHPISSTAQKIGLFRRRERSFGSQLSCYYLLQTLRSYPKMMLSNSLPSFIHERCGGFGSMALIAGLNESPRPLPEPLAICKSIMCMYFSKTSESTSFVWRTIETELNRLGAQVSELSFLLNYLIYQTNS